MHHLFDMISGTSSSSILAAFLARPPDVNTTWESYASEVVKVFETQGQTFFATRKLNEGALWIITIVSGLIGGVIGLKMGIRYFENPEVEEALVELKRIVKEKTEEQQINVGIQENED